MKKWTEACARKLGRLMLLKAGLLCATNAIGQQKAGLFLRGLVTDISSHPLAFAGVRILETGYTNVTNNKGEFRLQVPDHGIDSITLFFSFVNKQETRRVIYRNTFSDYHRVTLTDQSLTLQEVEVQAKRENAHSVSSIIFDREAIVQSQAFSLADILNKLPGKVTNAPSLQTPQTLTLRTSSAGMNAISNSFGIAIYIDGVRMSNDANMQTRSLSMWGVQNSAISSHVDNGNSYDVTYNGFDLRDIPIERIERIEVIQGIADARYGEMTSGAILITTRAGRTPVGISVNLNAGSSQLTVSKGFRVSKKAGAINLSAGYTNSNADPRNSVKSYNRLNTSLQWTVDISERLKNTFSFSYDTRLDNVKQDPDDDSRQSALQKGHTVTLSNRLNWDINSGFFNRLSLSASYSRGRQESYNQWLLNQPPSGIADKDTTGIYEGYFIPGNYLAVEHIIGIPVSVNANIDLNSKTFFTGNIMHRISIGSSVAVSGNRGPGIIIDPTRPRWKIVSNQSQRPVNFDKTLPYLTSNGFYFQDNMSGTLFGKKYTATLGVRADVQNGFAAFQPRLSATYQAAKNWSFSIAYGISTKAPSLAYRYPAPAWIDIPVLNLYNGITSQSLFLVYTKKIESDNSQLAAAQSRSFELGINFKNSWSKTSIVGFARKNTGGFNSYGKYEPIYVPNYKYTIDPVTKKINYFPAGDSTMYTGISRYTITNGLYTGDYGIELMFSTQEIKAIATSFSLRSSLTYSVYDARRDHEIVAVSASFIQQGKPALYGVYRPKSNTSSAMVSTVSSITHIPKLGFVITVSTDLTMIHTTRNSPRSNDPIAYINRNVLYVSIDPKDAGQAQYDYLRLVPGNELTAKLPFMYPCVNVTIAKEIKQKIRLMLTGYNIFNIQPQYITTSGGITNYNSPVSISAGLTFQL